MCLEAYKEFRTLIDNSIKNSSILQFFDYHYKFNSLNKHSLTNSLTKRYVQNFKRLNTSVQSLEEKYSVTLNGCYIFYYYQSK